MLFSTIIKWWCQPFGLHSSSLTISFVCNFLSSSAGFNLCSCFFRLTLVFRFRFRRSLGRPIHGLSPLPFRFLTSAVSAFFRPLQFWILTTQPLLFLSFSSRFRLTVASSVRPLCFRFLGFPPSLRPGFPCLPSGFLYSAFLFVSFRPSLLRSHSCSTGAYPSSPTGILP